MQHKFCDMLQGVVDMHDAGWAHLDLKPDNVCMELRPGTPGSHSYVIDYGSALRIGTGVPTELNVAVVLLSLLSQLNLEEEG